MPLTEKALGEADCVLITTDHGQTDWRLVVRKAKIVIDTRNATKNVADSRNKIILL